MLSELQQKDVWEGWIGAEIRTSYFADMAQGYQTQQKVFTVMILLFSSGAAATFITDWLPENMAWVKPLLALITATLSFINLIQQNQKRVTECSDLHFRWNRLASEYKSLWGDMYSEEARARLEGLEEKAAELSKSSMAIPNKKRTMLKWQAYVNEQHGLATTA